MNRRPPTRSQHELPADTSTGITPALNSSVVGPTMESAQPTPTKGKPGRKPKAAAAETSTKKDSPTPKAKGKPGRKPKKPTTKAAVPKRGHGEVELDPELEVEPPVKKTKVVATKSSQPTRILPPRSARPSESTPTEKKPRRTHQEVLEAAKQKEADQIRLVQLAEERKELLARMELDEEDDDANEARLTVRSLNDIQDPSDEDMGFLEVGDGDDEDEQAHEVSGKKKQPQKQKKAERGETRAAVDEMKEKIRSKRNAESDLKAEGQKGTKKIKPAFPSGLITNWEAKVTKTPGLSHSKPAAKNAPQAKPDSEVEVLGGLKDSDAYGDFDADLSIDIKPDIRKNELIEILDSDSDIAVMQTPKSIHRTNRQGPAMKTPARRPVKRELTDHSITSSGVKSESSSQITIKRSASNLIPFSPSPSDASQLPQFAKAGWATHFLPTLYHALFCSASPWTDFVKGPGIEKTFQEVVDIVYPGNTYTVRWGDKLCQMAYDRLCDKRSAFGKQGLTVVKLFFQTKEYFDNPAAIIKYCNWALRHDGPAIYKTPTPESANDSQDINYIKPQGFFESTFIIDTIKPFSAAIKKSLGTDFGNPKGAFALAAASIERAFMMHTTGTCKTVGDFSGENNSGMVKDYMLNALELSPRRWKSILTASGMAAPPTQITLPASTRSLQSTRHALYIPSSPAASEGEMDEA